MYNRVISLVPSLTEFIADVAPEKLIGRTRFCIHPAPFIDTIPIIGGTKQVNFESIKSLQPDIIIMSREENRKEDADKLTVLSDIHVTDIVTVDDAFIELSAIGKILGKKNEANHLLSSIKIELDRRPVIQYGRTLYMIWKNPWMSVGGDTYINDVLKLYGFENLLVEQQRYPELTLREIKELKPELILLSSEPYPFKEDDLLELQNEIPQSKIVLIDGEWFSWYGSRMKNAFHQLNQLAF